MPPLAMRWRDGAGLMGYGLKKRGFPYLPANDDSFPVQSYNRRETEAQKSKIKRHHATHAQSNKTTAEVNFGSQLNKESTTRE